MVMPMLMATGQALSSNGPIERWARRAFLAAVPLSALMVVGTFSRGGFLALVASVLAFLLLQKRRFAAIVLLVVLLAVALPFIPIQAGYVERLQTITDYQQEGSAETRIYFWGLAVDMAMEHPLGIGLRNFEYAYDQYDKTGGKWGHGRAVHSSFFQVLAETGVPGIVVWVAQCSLAFVIGWRIRRRSYSAGLADEDRHFLFVMANGLMVSMCGFLVGGMFLGLALNDLTWLTFGVLAGLDRLSLKMVDSAVAAPVAVGGGQP
jgi:putative inorganic carbon (hco3(-)) transporter